MKRDKFRHVEIYLLKFHHFVVSNFSFSLKFIHINWQFLQIQCALNYHFM